MSSIKHPDRLAGGRFQIRMASWTVLAAILCTVDAVGQELPAATPEGNRLLDRVIRDGEKSGALHTRRDEKGQLIELSVTDVAKLRELVGREGIRDDLRLRDTIIAEAARYDAGRSPAWCALLEAIADSPRDEITRGFFRILRCDPAQPRTQRLPRRNPEARIGAVPL